MDGERRVRRDLADHMNRPQASPAPRSVAPPPPGLRRPGRHTCPSARTPARADEDQDRTPPAHALPCRGRRASRVGDDLTVDPLHTESVKAEGWRACVSYRLRPQTGTSTGDRTTTTDGGRRGTPAASGLRISRMRLPAPSSTSRPWYDTRALTHDGSTHRLSGSAEPAARAMTSASCSLTCLCGGIPLIAPAVWHEAWARAATGSRRPPVGRLRRPGCHLPCALGISLAGLGRNSPCRPGRRSRRLSRKQCLTPGGGS